MTLHCSDCAPGPDTGPQTGHFHSRAKAVQKLRVNLPNLSYTFDNITLYLLFLVIKKSAACVFNHFIFKHFIELLIHDGLRTWKLVFDHGESEKPAPAKVKQPSARRVS